MDRSPLNPTGATEDAPDPKQAAAAHEALSWLDPLCENPHFRRFLDEGVRTELLIQQKAALDVTTPPEKRNDHAQRCFALTQIYRWADKQREACLSALASAEKRRDAKSRKPKPVL